MDLETLIAEIQNPGPDGPRPGIYDDLTALYGDLHSQVSNVTEGSAARIAELTATIDTLQAEIQNLKAQNFDLLMNVPGNDATNDSADEPDDEGESGVDDLFGEGE